MKTVMILMLLLGCTLSAMWFITTRVIVEYYTSSTESTESTETRVKKAMETISTTARSMSLPTYLPQPVRIGGFSNPFSNLKLICPKQTKFDNINVDNIQSTNSLFGSVNFKSRVNVNNVNAKSFELNNKAFFKSTMHGLVIGDS